MAKAKRLTAIAPNLMKILKEQRKMLKLERDHTNKLSEILKRQAEIMNGQHKLIVELKTTIENSNKKMKDFLDSKD
tara:strand:- start:177 stop:404 length:228 start_codon:yes stop_codon:yes gene_type:complete